MTEIPASEELLSLALFAIDHGVDSISDGGALVPFAVTEDEPGRRALTRFVSDRLEDGVEAARRFAKESRAARVAVAYDAFVTLEGRRTDAIIAEAQESNAASGVVFAQRYRPAGRRRKLEAIGNTSYMGERALR